jgi:hypothetical protein
VGSVQLRDAERAGGVTDHPESFGIDPEVSLVEILDRTLGAGVVLTGDVTLSLADVDLVYLSLRICLGSVPTIRGESTDAMPTLASTAEDSR